MNYEGNNVHAFNRQKRKEERKFINFVGRRKNRTKNRKNPPHFLTAKSH